MTSPNSRRRSKRQNPPYQVIHLDSWQHFVEFVTNPPYSNWAFRGQSDARWPLFSVLSRYFISFGLKEESWAYKEMRTLRIFKRKSHLFLDHIPDSDDNFQWLALMQHHGAPTRLLDLTWSPYVAAFFALDRSTSDAAVWALNFSKVNGPHHAEIYGGNLQRSKNFNRFIKSPVPLVGIGDPYVMNRRLIAQSGTFAVPGILNKPVEDILSGYPDPSNTLVKFILAKGIRDLGMRELYRMNITPATLFPDLDGLARSMAYELEFEWWSDDV